MEIDKGILRIWDRRGWLFVKVFTVRTASMSAMLRWRSHSTSPHALHKLGKKAMAHGMSVINHVEPLCDTCVTTKQRRRPFPRQPLYHA